MLDDFRVCRVPGSSAAMISVTPARRQLRGPRQTQTGPEPALEQAEKCPALFAGCNSTLFLNWGLESPRNSRTRMSTLRRQAFQSRNAGLGDFPVARSYEPKFAVQEQCQVAPTEPAPARAIILKTMFWLRENLFPPWAECPRLSRAGFFCRALRSFYRRPATPPPGPAAPVRPRAGSHRAGC